MGNAALVFRGTSLERKVLPSHPQMDLRQRFAVTFRVDELWKGTPGPDVILYDVEPGSDCQGMDYQLGREYLVYAVQQASQDYRLEDRFWFGWTDVVSKGSPMLTSMVACTPGGDTAREDVRRWMRQLGKGRQQRRRP